MSDEAIPPAEEGFPRADPPAGEEEAEDEEEWNEDEWEPLFSCPFCGGSDDGCEHYLGSRDMHYSDAFSVDMSGPLDELRDDFSELELAATFFLESAQGKALMHQVSPIRLRTLLDDLNDGRDDVQAFQKYLFRLARDAATPITDDSYTDDGGHSGSTVQLFWVRNAKRAAAGMQKRLARDIRLLEKLSPET